MRTHLFSRDFTILVVGQIISLFGNSILRFALSLYVLDLTGSAAVFGGILALSMIPTVLLAPFGGLLADRIPRQRIMWGLDFATAALVAGFALALGTGGGLTAITVMMMALSVIQAIYQPSVLASIPALAAEEKLMAANGVVVQVQALAGLLGPILGGMLYGFLVPSMGLRPILLTGAVCFFISAVMELFLRIPFTPMEGGGSPLRQARDDLGQALRFLVRENPRTARFLLIVAGLNLFLAALFMVGLPYLVKIHLGLSAQLYGFAEAALGCGSIVGGLCSGLAAKRGGLEHSYGYLLATALLMLPIAAVLAAGAPAGVAYGVILVCVLLGMAACALFNIAAQTFLQKETPPHLLGKVASFVTVVCVCATPVGQAMYGLLFQYLGQAPWAVVLFGALVSAGLALGAKKAAPVAKE